MLARQHFVINWYNDIKTSKMEDLQLDGEERTGLKNMNQRWAPSSWGWDTTAGLFWRLLNQRRETTA